MSPCANSDAEGAWQGSGGTRTLSVVICAHNEEAWIGRTLASLMQQKRLPDEIVVVNNASTDGTERIVREFMAVHPA